MSDEIRILAMGYFKGWCDKVKKASPHKEHQKFIALPQVAMKRYQERPFHLLILGNRVDHQDNAGLKMLAELREIYDDHTPVIIFSHEINEAGIARVSELDGHFIDYRADMAVAELSEKIAELLDLTQA